MGLIKEPNNIDFYVIDKPWTDEERKEFSAFIKKRKQELKKSHQRKRALKINPGNRIIEQKGSVESKR